MEIAVVGAPGTGVDLLLRDLPAALLTADLPQACVLLSATDLREAVEHDFASGDSSHFYESTIRHRTVALTLLSGLDSVHSNSMAQVLNTRLRQALDRHNLPYAVVYGDARQRIHHAVQAIAHRQQFVRRPPSSRSAWQWQCEKCSDAACEHRLFSELLKTQSVRS